MITINAGNVGELRFRSTTTTAPTLKTYRKKKDACAAAVATLGEHARLGFEYEAFKCDGLWRWRANEGAVKPRTAADIKASGGRRSLLTTI